MRRILLISLATFVLLAQWGLVAHAYHEHTEDDAQVCELCLNHKVHNQALLPDTTQFQINSSRYIPATFVNDTFITQFSRHYSVRGPPVFL